MSQKKFDKNQLNSRKINLSTINH